MGLLLGFRPKKRMREQADTSRLVSDAFASPWQFLISYERSIFILSLSIPNKSYTSRKRRWQQLAKELPEVLQEFISPRDVEAASRFALADQNTLAAVLKTTNGRRQPTAIRFLAANPGAAPAEVLARQMEKGEKRPVQKPRFQTSVEPYQNTSLKDYAALADLLIEFGLHKNRVVARPWRLQNICLGS